MESGSEISRAKKRRLEEEGDQHGVLLPDVDFLRHSVPSGAHLFSQTPGYECAAAASIKSGDVSVSLEPAGENSSMQIVNSPVLNIDNTIVCFGVVGPLML